MPSRRTVIGSLFATLGFGGAALASPRGLIDQEESFIDNWFSRNIPTLKKLERGVRQNILVFDDEFPRDLSIKLGDNLLYHMKEVHRDRVDYFILNKKQVLFDASGIVKFADKYIKLVDLPLNAIALSMGLTQCSLPIERRFLPQVYVPNTNIIIAVGERGSILLGSY